MARERRSRQDQAAEAHDLPADTGRPGSRGPVRVPSGPSFAMTVGMAAGLAAAALAFVGALGGAALGGDAGDAVDAGGVAAARMLAAPGAEKWRAGYGTTAAIRAKASEFLDARLASLSDARDKTAATSAVNDFRNGRNASGAEWRPGFDMIFPKNDPQDDLAEASRRGAIDKVVRGAPGGMLGAAVLDLGGAALVASAGADIRGTQGQPKMIGETKVWNFGGSRQYEHPLLNRAGAIEGRAVVHVVVPAPQSPMATAGLAALAALIGGFAVGFGIALGPVKSVRRLASDLGALADGQLDTRVAVAGPDVVQAAAKNAQRLAQLAASGAMAAAAEPQVIQQQVLVQPVAEVQEGLGPTKAFRRPEEFEIEATQKPCPDLGNDYYDVVNVDDEHVGVFVADIPNMRGVRGAMFMAQVRALFRANAPGNQNPAEVLKQVNRSFAADLPRGIYVTAMYAVVNRASGVCRVASAQHLPLVFWKASKKASARLPLEGIALGLDPGAVFDKTIAEKAIQLEKGDRIVLYTDGAITARNLSGAQYGDERFYYVVNREAPKNSAACVNFVANDVDLFHEGAPQTDDFTIVTLRKMR